MSRRVTVSVLTERENLYYLGQVMESRFVICCMLVLLLILRPSTCGRFLANFRHKIPYRVYYQVGNSEEDLPECAAWSVCNQVDTYSTPWVERQCRCPGKRTCSMKADANDGHTIIHRSKQFKICESVSKLPACRYFRDVTWTFFYRPDNITQYTVHCQCPKNSVAYVLKHQGYQTPEGLGHKYLFACSPQSKMHCQRKEPCKLFTVRKKSFVEDVTVNTLCLCPRDYVCPQHHSEPSVIGGQTYYRDHARIYSGYCTPRQD